MLLAFQVRAQLLTDDVLLIPDGSLFDSYALWALLARDGAPLIDVLCAPSAAATTSTAVVQTSGDASTTLDDAFANWLGREGELRPSCLDIDGLVPADHKARAKAYFQSIRGTKVSLDEFAREMKLDVLRNALPHMRRLYVNASRILKPEDRHVTFRDAMLAHFGASDRRQTPLIVEFLEYLNGAKKGVSRSEIKKIYRTVWDEQHDVINTLRQLAAVNKELASTWLAPLPYRRLDDAGKRVLDAQIRAHGQDPEADLFLLDDLEFAKIGALRAGALGPILRGLNQTAHMEARSTSGNEFRRQYKHWLGQWRARIIAAKIGSIRRERAEYDTLLQQLATAIAIHDGTGPAAGDAESERANEAVGEISPRLNARSVFATKTRYLSTAGIFADLVAKQVNVTPLESK